MGHDKTRELFNDWARRGRGEGMEAGHYPRAELALENMPVEPGDRVIDLGCGNGWATRWLRQCAGNSGHVAGIDLAPDMIELATKSAGGAEGIDFVEAAFENLPMADNSVDHAFSMEALYYASDVDVALKEIARVLRPGGTLTFCTDFYAENPYCHHWPEMMGVPMALMGEEGWREAMERASFSVSQASRCFDPRHVGGDVDADERAEVEDFRKNVGSLAILATL